MYTVNFNEKQKELFLDLSIHAALSNNAFKTVQKHVVESFCDEMGIDTYRYEPNMELAALLDAINNETSFQIRKMMFSEVMSVIVADGVIDDSEQKFVDEVAKGMDLPEDIANEITTACTDIMRAYNKLNVIMNT